MKVPRTAKVIKGQKNGILIRAKIAVLGVLEKTVFAFTPLLLVFRSDAVKEQE